MDNNEVEELKQRLWLTDKCLTSTQYELEQVRKHVDKLVQAAKFLERILPPQAYPGLENLYAAMKELDNG